jgi:hypothetical protein
VRKTDLVGVLAAVGLVWACAETGRTDATPAAAAELAAPAARLPRTPGMCGWWEDTAAEALEACSALALRSLGPPADSLLPGECGYYQVVHLDSLRACLGRAEALAAECSLVDEWSVRQADGQVRRAEWRRCGPEVPEWQGDHGVYPRHHLLLRADDEGASPVVFAIDNAEEEGFHGFDDVTAVDLDRDGTDELFFVDAIYGTGAYFESCALAVREGRILCWPGPDFALDSIALRDGETLYKGWIPVAGPPTETGSGPMRAAPGRSLWYFTPIYAPGDPNCCSSVGASLWLEARPAGGRFETGLLLRALEDSLGAVVSVDTLRR